MARAPRTGAPPRLQTALAFAVVAATLLLFVWPLFDPSVQLYDRDSARVDAPLKWELWRRLQAHQLPLWITWTEAGTSLFGQMTPALFHPSTLLYFFLPFELAFKLQHLLSLPVAAAGMFLLARRLGARTLGALAGALAFAGSGWFLSAVSSNGPFRIGFATLPWAVHALLVLLEKRRPLALLWAALVLASPVLAGEPQSALFAGLLGLAFALGSGGRGFGARDRLHPNDVRPRAAGTLAWLATWGVLALVFSAPASLPVAARLRAFSRVPGPTQSREMYAMPPWRIFGLAIPSAFDDLLEATPPGKSTAYTELAKRAPGPPFAKGIELGLPALLCALFAPRRKRVWLLGAALVCIAAATGPALPVDALALQLFPPFAWFRYPEKWLAPATFLFALAAGLGFSELFEPRAADDGEGRAHASPAPRTLARTALASALALGLLALSLQLGSDAATRWIAARMLTHPAPVAADLLQRSIEALVQVAGLCAALAAVAFLYARAEPERADAAVADARSRVRLAGRAPLLALCIVAVAILLDGLSLIDVAPLAELRAMPPLADHLRALAPAREFPLRIRSTAEKAMMPPSHNSRVSLAFWCAHVLTADNNAFSGIENVDSYSSLPDLDYLTLLNRAPRALDRLFDVQFDLEPPWKVSEARARSEGWELTGLGMLLQQAPPLPRAFLLGCAEPLEKTAAFDRLSAPDFDVRARAVVRPEDAPRLSGRICDARADASVAGGAAMRRPSPEEIDVEVEAARDALLVVSEHFDPGWSASIDGGAALGVVQIDRAAIGVPVPAGHHRVELRFFPAGLRLGCALATAAFVLLLAWAALFPRPVARSP